VSTAPSTCTGQHLMSLLESLVPRAVESAGSWRLFVAGDLGLLTPPARHALERAIEATRDRTHNLTLAIGYDGREDIVGAMRTALVGIAAGDGWPEIEDIRSGLAGGPNKEIDLVIRTGNEVRISGFFPWQSANAEIYTSRKMWPAFGQTDFVRALRFYARARQRRTP